MKRAIISDIHGNLEALQAVLADIDEQSVDAIYCLGDVIGYGPNPRECIDEAMRFDVCILGNHDLAALFDPEGFSSGAERAIFWTRRQLESANRDEGESDEAKSIERMEYLAERPRNVRENGWQFVHGSPRNPLNEYVFPEDIYNARKVEKIFSMVQQYCFQGHTHVPGVFTEDCRFISPADCRHRHRLTGQKTMVNVGSVGQPRDGDWRSCYVVLEDDVVMFRRVEYPVDQTVEKIYAIAEIDDFLGDRLREGR